MRRRTEYQRRAASRIAAVSAALLSISLLTAPADAIRPARLMADFSRARIVLETSGPRCLMLDAWLARSADQHARGLMFVEQMDEFESMLFLYQRPARLTMWMQNTYIPLDMAFFRADGSIAGIEADTTPMSTRRITSPADVTKVLEFNAGFSQRWQLEVGNRLLLVE